MRAPRFRYLALPGLAVLVAAGVGVALSAGNADASTAPSASALSLAREALPANDGWAAMGTGTTGGAAADDAHIFVVHNRAELVNALGGNNATNGSNATPKIIFVAG